VVAAVLAAQREAKHPLYDQLADAVLDGLGVAMIDKTARRGDR
jgi:hypothetical protein